MNSFDVWLRGRAVVKPWLYGPELASQGREMVEEATPQASGQGKAVSVRLAGGLEALAKEKIVGAQEKPVFDAQERAAGAENEDSVDRWEEIGFYDDLALSANQPEDIE